MSLKKPIERVKSKPRGRPFKKREGNPIIGNEVLDTPRHKGSVEGDSINNSEPAIVQGDDSGMEFQLPKEAIETINKIIQESSEKKIQKDLEVIESIDFSNGENILSIRFSKRHNRMFRIQIFLNGENEIRPVTYTGATTGYAFWNLLKGLVKK
jgi:hypothetical protein